MVLCKRVNYVDVTQTKYYCNNYPSWFCLSTTVRGMMHWNVFIDSSIYIISIRLFSLTCIIASINPKFQHFRPPWQRIVFGIMTMKYCRINVREIWERCSLDFNTYIHHPLPFGLRYTPVVLWYIHSAKSPPIDSVVGVNVIHGTTHRIVKASTSDRYDCTT